MNAEQQPWRKFVKPNLSSVAEPILVTVVDPNTLNLDPDPVFLPNLDPGLCQSILK